MLHFKPCTPVPERGGRGHGGRGWSLVGVGGLVEVEGRVVWRGGEEGMYIFDTKNSKFDILADGGEWCGTLAVCGKNLIRVGGLQGNGLCSNEVMLLSKEVWDLMKSMPVACWRSCVVTVGSKHMLVIGGLGDLGRLSNVQIFNDDTQTWCIGPPLPLPCWATSAVIHGDMVYVMGGLGMNRAVWSASITDLVMAHIHESVWKELPDVPSYFSSVCVINGVLLAIGGTEDQDGLIKTTTIYAFHHNDQKWQQVGDMPFKCSLVDTIALSREKVLIVDGDSAKVYEISLEDEKKHLLSPSLQITNETEHFEKDMSQGSINISVTKCLILGAPGVGKTHLKYLLLKKDPPEQRVSTGLADNPVRAISFSLVGVSGQFGDDWLVVENEKALRSFLKDIEKTNQKMTTNNGVHLLADVSTISTKGTLQLTKLKCSEKKHGYCVKLIQYIDSGGQLQYHDMLPLFIQNPRVAVFVLNLSEDLSHYPSMDYYGADGKPIGKPYKSSLSHEQILQHSLEIFRSQDVRPLIITVGTHVDTADKCSESINTKDQKLLKLMDANRFNVLYSGERLENVIYSVNSKAPTDKDRDIAKILRQKIVSNTPVPNMPPTIRIPMASIELDFALRRLSGKAGILTIAECKEHAKILNIEGDAFKDAMDHLVYNNVFLYYPEVLQDIVFCDPQVVLTKVTEIVQYHYKLRDNPDEDIAAEGNLLRFRDYGLVSIDLLIKFSSNYKEGLFTPQDLLKLLEHVQAIAMIGGGEYLMPALLPHLNNEKLQQYLHDTTPLIIRPMQGCIPSGLFCCFSAHLLSPTNPSHWKVCMEGDKPLCLFHNCVSFLTNGTAEIVTIVNKSSYIQIHVDEPSMEVCKEVKKYVHSCIKNACRMLKYHDVQFLNAFMCEGSRCSSDPPHVADCVPSPDRTVPKWRCNRRQSQRGNLSKGQLMWMGENVMTAPDPSTSGQLSLDHEALLQECKLGPPTLPLLLDFPTLGNIIQKISINYLTFGTFLLNDSTGEIVDALRQEHLANAENITTAILKRWLQDKSPNSTFVVAWSTIVNALRKSNLHSLADQIDAVTK